MHASSLENMQKCYERFVKPWSWNQQPTLSVVDIGGANVNGSYADIFSPAHFNYQAVDIAPGEGVDVVLDSPYQLPFADASVDLLISGQAFEHVEFFWKLFKEMSRVLHADGLLILIAPSAGPIHRFPVDCYRFYPDAYHALARYGGVNLLHCQHDNRGPWNDLVGVFCKRSLVDAEANIAAARDPQWPLNRLEQETAPAPSLPAQSDELEIVQGDVAYRETLAKLHQCTQPSLYLEIGVKEGGSLQLAKCPAIGIDPQYQLRKPAAPQHRLFRQASDDFFELAAAEIMAAEKPDLVFIDGMHLFEFALRDFINVERFSQAHTVVVVDDVLPNHPRQAERQRQTRVWMGDVWKLVECLTKARPDLQLTLLNTRPSGLLVITGLKSENRVLQQKYNPLIREFKAQELSGERLQRILQRKAAIAADDDNYWRWLENFVATVKAAKGNAKQVAEQNIHQWRERKAQ